VAVAQSARQGRSGPRAGWGGSGGPELSLRALNLTESQRGLIRDIRERHRGEGQQVGERLRQALQAQRKAVESVPLNEGLIRATTQELAAAQTDAAIHRARVFNEIWSVLTPEQQAQTTKLRAAREQRMQQRRDRQRRSGDAGNR
jgi:Spy/CpxP family protein refolding chaperone